MKSIYLDWSGECRYTLEEMLKACPWFDEKEHLLIALEDSSGNCVEIIGCGKNFKQSIPALKEAWKRKKGYDFNVEVLLLRNLRAQSFVF